MFNKNEDVFHRFSPQEKELLTLLIIYSTITPYYYNRNITGVTNEILTNSIWPNCTPGSLKNRKGVLLNKIRKKLENIPWLKIESTDNQHFLSIDTSTDIDFISFILLKKCNMTDKIVSELINIFSKGTLFENASYHWLETIQTKINLDIIELLLSIMNNKTLLSSNKKNTANILLQYDPINLNSMEFLIREYKKENQISIAKYLYNQFDKRYRKYFNESFPKKFKTI